MSSYAPTLEKVKSSNLSFSLVLETENLGQAGMDDLRDTLESLRMQTYPITDACEVLVIAAGHVSDEALEFLRVEYPWVKVHRVEHPLEYLESKKYGAEIATGDIVVYADSDVTYQDSWLLNLLYGFIVAPGATIVMGDTRVRGSSVYDIAMQIVWMLDVLPAISSTRATFHFDLNNFAIKRFVMCDAPIFTGLPLYRAHTVEMRKQLFDRGYSAVRVPNARGLHLAPETFMDWFSRCMIQGADAVAKSEYVFNADNTTVRTPSLVRRMVRIPVFLVWKAVIMTTRVIGLLREDSSPVVKIILALPIAVVSWIVMGIGSVIALFDRQAAFRFITARETQHVV
jgi:glycosyltransferase involved in cell wall biosynthesis